MAHSTSTVCEQSIFKVAQEEHDAYIAMGKTNGLII